MSSAANDRLSRRRFLHNAGIATAGIGVSGLLAACGDDAPAGGTKAATSADGLPKPTSTSVIYADFGGSTREVNRAIYFDPFEKETGIKVISADVDYARLTAMVKRDRVQWDALDTDGYQGVEWARAGVLEPLPKGVTRVDEVQPAKYQKWLSGGYCFSIVQTFREDTFKGKTPETWDDFWNVSKFPGKRALPGFGVSVIEAALIADGVPASQLYPLDFDRAFAKLDEIRDDTLFYESYGESQQFLATGSVALCAMANGRASQMQAAGQPVVINWNEAILYPFVPDTVPTGAPHADAAFTLVDFKSQAEHQAAFARLIKYGPTNTRAFDLLEEDELAELPNSPQNSKVAVRLDQAGLADQNAEYQEAYGKWLVQG